MGWIEDSLDEFRKLPPAGKVAVGAAGVGVAILAYAQYRSRASSAATNAAASAGGAGVGLSTLSGGPGTWGSNAPPASATSGASVAPADPWTALRQAGVGIITSPSPRIAPGPSGGAHLNAPTVWTTRAGQTITISAGGASQ